MNLHLNDEQRLLCDSLNTLLSAESTPERVRAAEASGFDAQLWRQLSGMGLHLLRVPHAAGGLDSSLFDAVLVSERLGRHLASVPFVEALVASRLLSLFARESAPAWLDRLHAGAVVSLALHDVHAVNAPVVAAGAFADAVLACQGEMLWLITAGKPTRVEATLGANGTCHRSLSTGEERILLAQGPEARAAFQRAREEWKLLTAAALGGLAHKGLELAAAYAVERQAFGRPIGSFQGIAHPLADAVTEVEGAQLLAWYAAWAVAQGTRDAAASISMALWWASESSARAMSRALHTFGGYGVSLEYDIQLYYRRAKAWAITAGDPQRELQCIAARLWGHGGLVALPDAGDIAIDFSLGAAAEAFGARAQEYFARELTPELRAHAHHSVAGFDAAFNRQLARDGLLFPHWPKEYGGQGRTPYDLAALTAVMEAAGWEHVTAPITNQVGSMLMSFGTAEAKREVLPRFAAGEALACMGFTEPSCGCDVFAVKTRAERQPDGQWLIQGQKIFTTAANLADYCLLLARTNPDKPKHAGLSMFLVPMKSAGIEVQAVHTVQDERTNIVYLSDVRVPAQYLVGPVDGGLQVMASTLEMEHGSADQYRQGHVTMVHAAEIWARDALRDGRPLLDDSAAAARLARARVHLQVSTVLCRRAIWAMAESVPSRFWGPMAKLFATETYQRDALDLMDLAAPETLFASKVGLGHVELGFRQSIGTTIYGGTSEVQRSLIAEQALGLPKSRS